MCAPASGTRIRPPHYRRTGAWFVALETRPKEHRSRTWIRPPNFRRTSAGLLAGEPRRRGAAPGLLMVRRPPGLGFVRHTTGGRAPAVWRPNLDDRGVAPGLGFEPRRRDSESLILPLDDPGATPP